jgi:hypothetical protein
MWHQWTSKFPPVDGFTVRAGNLPMPGKPHGASFPEETFAVKDRFGLDSDRKGLNPMLDHSHSIVAGGLPLMS